MKCKWPTDTGDSLGVTSHRRNRNKNLSLPQLLELLSENQNKQPKPVNTGEQWKKTPLIALMAGMQPGNCNKDSMEFPQKSENPFATSPSLSWGLI